ncbi:MAG: LON peptidase substrate-binding domain-containing protein [Candidatus Eisenbacteria bacterium]|nr:LON peptidase substrate-binding domain-containing protein [Candidatus Eisenbacteria bacterium]
MVPLRDQVLFPGVTIPLYFSRPETRLALEAALQLDRRVLVTLQKDSIEDHPDPSRLHSVGTLANIIQAVDGEAPGLRVVLQGEVRARWEQAKDQGGWQLATAELLGDIQVGKKPGIIRDLVHLRSLFSEYSKLEPRHSPGLTEELGTIRSPAQLLEFIAAHLLVSPSKRQEILQSLDLQDQVRQLESCMKMEISRLAPPHSRRDLLTEAGPPSERSPGTGEDLVRLIQCSELPNPIQIRALEEAHRLSHMPPLSPEGVVVRTYIDWLLALPWKKKTKDRTDLKRARRILNKDHEGLEPVKERILEAVAVIRHTRCLPPTILALIGPPGVGKTSLGQSIATALGRKFARISLGGIRDEAEIRGHRRTYVGSMPGRIIQALRRTGTINPVLMLDEIDKLGADVRGNPAAALLEILDPEQNKSFSDHYLEVDYDLRQVLFIATANSVVGIPPALKDRLEILPLPGYHEEEKVRIAVEHLIPKMERLHGLKAGELSLHEDEIRHLIRHYTHEAGVRGAERALAHLCRRTVLRQVEGGPAGISPGVGRLRTDLGPPPFPSPGISLEGNIGRTLGLGVTSVGGEVLPVEVMVLPGRGKILVTGGAGSALKDSVRAALTCARAHGIVHPSASPMDIHVHLPRGELAKDGPSAGAAIYLALVSALRSIPAADHLALTGEITLHGRIMPVGGLREKFLAAWREGIQLVLFPADQSADVDALPAAAREALRCLPVREASQILEYGLKSQWSELADPCQHAA